MTPDHDIVRRQYDRLAGRYDRRWQGYVRSTTRETAVRLGVRAGERLLDVGCGTGALLEWLSSREPGVILAGLDPSPAMLAAARAKLPPAVTLRPGFAEQIPFGDAEFDVVVSASAFHYFRQPDAALREMRRVLRPGGRVVVTDWCDDYLACRLCDRVLRLLDPAHFRAYGSAECRRFLEAAGLKTVVVERYRISWLWGLMTASAVNPADP